MPKHEVLDPDRPGRRAGIRRLAYRPSLEVTAGTKNPAKGRWLDNREWSTIKDQLRLTVRRAPEVVINVKGSRRAKDDDRAAIAGVLRYMMYISRNGRLPLLNEHGERIEGSEVIKKTHAEWDLDMQRMRSAKNEPLHPSFNLIFSMPADTAPDKILDAVSAVTRANFTGHQYMMAVHTPETDPADDPPAHPHVHVIVRAEDEDGKRLHIRKADLRAWRGHFAKELRLRGIDANSTSRAERGKSFKSIGGAEWHIQKRYEESLRSGKSVAPSTAKLARFLDAARELQDGPIQQKPWAMAMAARRRDLLRDLGRDVVLLRQEGDHTLADEVERFVRDLPQLDTERHKMQRSMVKQVQDRFQSFSKERESGKQ